MVIVTRVSKECERQREVGIERERERGRGRALKFFRTEKNCNSLVLFFSFSSLPLFGPCKLFCHTKTQTEVHTHTHTAHMHMCVCVCYYLAPMPHRTSIMSVPGWLFVLRSSDSYCAKFYGPRRQTSMATFSPYLPPTPAPSPRGMSNCNHLNLHHDLSLPL